MRRTRAFVLLTPLFVACSRDLTAPPHGPDLRVQAAIAVAGQLGSTPGFNFLPPIVQRAPELAGESDLSLRPTIVICAVVGNACTTAIATLSGADVKTQDREDRDDGDDGDDGDDPKGGHYRANWEANDPRLSESGAYRIVVSVGTLVLGYADLVVDAGSRAMVDRSRFAVVRLNATLPIKFRVQRGAVSVVSTDGGSASALNGGALLDVPRDALASPTAISIVPAADPPAAAGTPTVVPGTTFDFNPAGLAFQTPATLTLDYDPALVPGGVGAEQRLRIYHFANGAWRLIPNSSVDPDAHTVSAPIDGFSSYSIGVIPADVTGTLSVGDSHACAIRGSGTLCWGANSQGSLGTGAFTPPETTPQPVTGDRSYALISAGLIHTCALDQLGKAWCWGSGTQGQLGNGAVANSAVPVAAATNHTFVDISTGAFHTCGLDASGDLWCWGSNGSGELGNGANTSSLVPVRVTAPPGVSFATISLGGLNTCALSTTQDAYCWGSNVNGQLGDNSITNRNVPTPVAGGHKFQALAIGSVNSILNSTCGVEPNGTAWCWGNNNAGQLGISTGGSPNSCTFGQLGPFACAWTPQTVQGNHVFDLVIPGNQHTCGQTRTGAVACWGYNGNGQLGDGTRVSRATPAIVGLPETVTLVGVGGLFSCAQTTNSIYCWGNSSSGQVGTGIDGLEPSPVQVAGGGWQAVTGNPCAIDASGTVSCWGTVPMGTPSVFDPTLTLQTNVPTPVGGPALAQISGTSTFACGLDASGNAYCWGRAAGNVGIGDGVNVASTIPRLVAGGHTFISISVSASHACAVEPPSARVWCWGNNGNGQLGNNSTAPASTPVQASSSASFTSVSAGNSFTCAVASTGEVHCWGLGRFGQLGFPWTAPPFPGNQLTPQPVPGVTGATRVAAAGIGGAHACAITSGSLTCWGANTNGQLGVPMPSPPNGSPPTAVPGLSAVTDVSAGGNTTCAVAAGSLYCWGFNGAGQVGDGTFITRTSPVSVPLTGIISVAVGASGTCALQNSGVLYCFGNNGSGAVGAPLPYVLTPARVM
jgi:alpha-tubulin suppressor-like RCC1 family protein